MTARLSRRLLVGATSAALLGGSLGAVSLLGSASAACTPTYTDDAGDAALVDPALPAPLGNDADLDILDVTHTVDAGVFRSIIHVAGLEEAGSALASVDEFETAFTVNGKAVTVHATRDHTTDPETDTGTLSVAGTATTVPVKVVLDLTGEKVTTEIAAPAFDTAVGGASGKPFSAMSASAIQSFGLPVGGPTAPYTQDEATAAAGKSYTFGASCSGTTGPAPSGSSSASPSPTASATATASPSPSPSPTKAADGTFLLPRKNCAQFTDPTGDADPTGIGALNEGSLDITQMNLKSPAGQLQLFVKVAAADEDLAPTWDGREYNAGFTVNAKKVLLTAGADGPATATVGGTANTDIKATAKIDVAGNAVVFTVPLDGLNKAAGTTVRAGTPITDPIASTGAGSPLGTQPADDAAGTKPAEKTYTYGDNNCFIPPLAKITINADKGGQYGDTTVFYATMKDADDAPVVGAKLLGAITGTKILTAVTDTNGTATFKVPMTVASGTKWLVVLFNGNDQLRKTLVRQTFVVSPEKTVLKVSRVSRGVRAQLLDDDRHPVAGRTVVFTVGSKRYSVTTDRNGVAVLRNTKTGTTVKVSFPAVPRYYLAAPTVTTKAG
jgi:hypothetical protein